MQTVADSGLAGQMFGHRQVRILIRGIVVALIIASIMLFLDWGLRSGTMPIEEITFKGKFDHISHSQLENVIARHLKNNFLIVNLGNIQKDIEKLPWVYRASVRRKWPTGLHIEYMEQEPVARWGDKAWLNSYGVVIHLDNYKPEADGIPVLTGPEKDSGQLLKKFDSYQKLFATAGLKLARLAVSDRYSYRLTTASGIEIILGKQKINERLVRFLDIYRENLAGHQGSFSRVDLRYTNGFAVLWNETASIEFTQDVFWGTYVKT
jgi:cell division protein FtsQ